jgi:hypothetical protein
VGTKHTLPVGRQIGNGSFGFKKKSHELSP